MNLIQTDDWFEPFHCDWRNSFITPIATLFIHGMRWTGIQWGIGGLALSLLGVSILLSRGQQTESINRAHGLMLPSLISAGLAAFFFASEWSYPVWQYAPLIDMVQWPYRFLAVLMPLGILATVLCGDRSSTRWKKQIAISLLASLAAMNALLQIRNAPTFTSPDFDRMQTLKYYSRPANLGPNWQKYLARGGFNDECAKNNVTLIDAKNRSQAFAWCFQAKEATSLTLPVMTYPGWLMHVNGKEVELQHDEATGLIVAAIPGGSSHVSLAWQTLPQERVGQVMSLAGLVITGVMIIWSLVRKSGYDTRQ